MHEMHHRNCYLCNLRKYLKQDLFNIALMQHDISHVKLLLMQLVLVTAVRKLHYLQSGP